MDSNTQLIGIGNRGPEIVQTNYWDHELAAKGFFFISINAGTFRLLVPDTRVSEIGSLQGVREVIISRGPWPEMMKSDALEILFEDDSDSPFVLHLTSSQIDHMPRDADRDRKGQPPMWKFSAWTRNGKIMELPCRYRLAKQLPYLKPWNDQ